MPASPPLTTTAARPRILLVEDNATQAKLLTTIIRQLGLLPLGPVPTAAEALALCRQDWPDIAILDINLPGAMDGVALANELSQQGNLPLIFISAAASEAATQQRVAPTQPLALLPKPYRFETLQQLITQGLALSSAAFYPVVAPPVAAAAAAPKALVSWLFVRENGALVRVLLADIVCVYMNQQHAELVLASGRRHSVRVALGDLLGYLPATDFVQCHRSWVVNVQHIEQVVPASDLIRLTGGAEAAMGRSYRQQVMQQLIILG